MTSKKQVKKSDENKEKKKEIKPSAVEVITGEKPKPKEEIKVDMDKPADEIVDVDEDVENELKEHALDKLFDRDNLSMITDINRSASISMARAKITAKERNCKILDEYADSIKEHLISNKRQGRGEAVKVIHIPADSFGEPINEETPTFSKLWNGNKH